MSQAPTAASPSPRRRPATTTTENFPTASLLLARPLRAKVMAFYRFVRTADDIADSADLPPAEKLAPAGRDGARRWTTPAPPARGARLHRAASAAAEARLMLSAFRQDAVQTRYADWAALEDYCRRSADPVGRMLLRLHGDGGNAAANAAADGLCTALQVLNHLQDLVPDRAALDRIYLPSPGWRCAGGEAAFFDPANAARRREVLDAALDRVEEALDRAAALPRLLQSRRLACQSTVTIALARRLLAKLRAADPVLGRVALGKADFAAAFAAAPGARPARCGDRGRPRLPRRLLLRPRHGGAEGRAAAGALGGLCLLPRGGRHRRRRHAGGREAPLPGRLAPQAGRRRTARCRASSPGRAQAYGVPLAECEAMIAGMETDAADRLRLANEADARPLLPPGRRQRRRHGGAHLRRAGGGGLRPGARPHLPAHQHPARRGRGCAARAGLHPARPAGRGGHPGRAGAGIVAHPALRRHLRQARRSGRRPASPRREAEIRAATTRTALRRPP